MNVEIEVRPARYGKRGYGASRTRVYFNHANESIMENLIARRSRPRDLYATYLPEVAEKLGLPRTTKFRWSQKAGCECGCSPGFICVESYGKDVWVRLSADAPQVADDAGEQVRVRLAQVIEAGLLPNLIEQ